MLRRALIHNRLILIPAVAVAAVIPVLAPATPAAAQSSVSYVALGDSYAAGDGAGSYSGTCGESANDYAARWYAANDPVAYANKTCDGATTSEVISGQLSALSHSTTLVSLTVGGDDIGFSSVMRTCVIYSTSTCVSAVDGAESEIASDLPGGLDKLLADIHADAPSARVVVMDYPHLYDLSHSWFCPGLTTTDRTDLNQASDELDDQIQVATQKYGDVFADVRNAFAGHEICDLDPWIHSVNWFDLGVSYHPTAAGQQDGYLPVFSAAAAG